VRPDDSPSEQHSSTTDDYDSFIQVVRSFVDLFRPSPNQEELSKLLGFYDFDARGNTVVVGTSFYIGGPPRQKIDAQQMKRDYSFRIDRMITVIRDETGLHIAGRPSDHCERRDE
jgi:hypothetical protein